MKMNNSINANKLAQYIIWYANKRHIRISHMKLQKLLYFIQIEYITKYHALLFDDLIEAGRYGPVVKSVYYDYCS